MLGTRSKPFRSCGTFEAEYYRMGLKVLLLVQVDEHETATSEFPPSDFKKVVRNKKPQPGFQIVFEV
jgi:hypothetical protein